MDAVVPPVQRSAAPQPASVDPRGPRKMLSIIMPARNEELNLPRAYEEVTAAMQGLAYDYEVIVIDNHSSDRTGPLTEEICGRDPRWRYLRFSRNFAVESSIAAGFRFARGDAALVLFSDLQDPPSMIPDFLRQWEAGFDVVYGVIRKREGDPWWKSLGAKLTYGAINWLADVRIPRNATDFRLLSRRAIDALNQLDERNRYVRGFAHWIGFEQAPILYDRRPRTAGNSKAPLLLMATLATNAITCFSIKPLQAFSLFGSISLIATVLLAVFYLGAYLFLDTVSGLTTVYLLLLANLTVLLFGVGILGEYIGRIYIETKGRPLFLVEKTVNLANAQYDASMGSGSNGESGGQWETEANSHPARGSGSRQTSDIGILANSATGSFSHAGCLTSAPTLRPARRATIANHDSANDGKTRFHPANLRKTVLNMAYSGSTVHVACAFSIIEIMSVLHRSHLRLNAADPLWAGRDYLVLSKGHGVMAQYACMHELGWVTDADIKAYFKDGSRLKGLSDAHVPGLEVTSGSLGHGLSVGVGLALAAKRKGTGQRTFAVIGDGEMNEGSIWEALLFAAQAQLNDLTVIVDANGFQAMGTTDEVMALGRLADKFASFGYEVREVDAHDEQALDAVLSELARHPSLLPRAVVAKTVKGKGVSFMEADNRWHYTRLKAETYAAATAELDHQLQGTG